MPLFPTKSVEQLQQEYFQSLANAGTGLRFDITQGSVINALARGSAAVAVSQYREIRRLAASITLADSVGEDLDIYSSYGVVRNQPSTSTGTVLALAVDTPVLVAPGTVLIDPQTALQFETLNTSSIQVSYLETPIPIRSLVPTPLANIAAGTRLYSQSLTTTSFVVGTTRGVDGVYSGSLTGGTDRESDEAYRERIATWLASHTTASQSSLVSRLLTFPSVNRAFTITNAGGVVEIWVDTISTTFNESQKAEIARYVKDYVSDGIIVTVSQIEKVPVDILLNVTPYANTLNGSYNNLSNRLREVILAQMQRLDLGQNFSREAVLKAIKPLAAAVTIQEPTLDVFIKNGQLAVLGDLHVTFPV